MESVKLSKLLDDFSLDKKKLAEQLFPNNKHPVLSFNRIVSGKGSLNSDQLSKLAAYIDRPIKELYSGDWKKEDAYVVEINCEDYIGLLNISKLRLGIFHKKSLHYSITHFESAEKINLSFNQISETVKSFK